MKDISSELQQSDLIREWVATANQKHEEQNSVWSAQLSAVKDINSDLSLQLSEMTLKNNEIQKQNENFEQNLKK